VTAGQPGPPPGEPGPPSPGHESAPPRRGPVAILIGPPGSGKTTAGALAAASLGTGFSDTDRLVEEMAGKPVSDIFVQDGEPAFRALERAAAARLIASQHGVLALGSGAVLDPGTRQLLAGQRVIYLEAGFPAVARRSGLDGPRPPVPGNPRGRLRQMLAERHPVYEGLAWRSVRTDDREPAEVAALLVAEIAALAGPDAVTP
jgi:shikimate kinase